MKTTKLISAVMLLVCMMSMISLSSCSEKDDDGEKKEAGSSNLRVTPASLKFDATGGTKSLTVTTTYEMVGVETTADWLDYDFNEATGLVHITATANNTDKARSTNLQVMGSNDGNTIKERVNIKVEQEAGSVDEGDAVFTVDSKGGKIEYGDIAIDFPSGTFSTSTKITVSEVEKGKIDGDLEISTYYQVKFSGGVAKSIKVAIRSPEYANDDNVKLQFVTPAWIPSGSTTGEAHSLIDMKYENDSYVAEISPMDSPEEIDNMTVSFGLVSYPTLDMVSSRMTRAGDDDFAVLWNNYWGFNEAKINRKMQDSWIPDVIAKIAVLGFEMDTKPLFPKTIKYIVRTLDNPGKWGACTYSYWAAEFNTIEVNYLKLMQLGVSGNSTELEKTLIHETLHYYQAYYDPRSAFGVQLDGESTVKILDEATAVWSERFYGDRLSNLTKNNVADFVATSNPEKRYIYDVINRDGNNWPKRYEAVGYGMSALIEYLSQRINTRIVIEMYNKRKRKEKNVYDSHGIVEDVANAHGIDIFSQTGYKDFIEQLGCGKVYPDFTFPSIRKIGRKPQGSVVGDTKYYLKEFGKSVNCTNLALGYGAIIELLEIVVTKLDGSQSDVLDNVSGIIEQKKDGLKTWVYGFRDKEYYPIGMTKKGSPLDISNSFYKHENNIYSNQDYFLVTIKDNFKDDTEIESNIEAKLEKSPVLLTVTPDGPIEFEAEGGSKTLTVTTNQPKWGGIKKGDWFKVETTTNTITLTADPNPTSDPREGYIEVYARNENKENVSEPIVIPIKQKAKAAEIFDNLKNISVSFKTTMHYYGNGKTGVDYYDEDKSTGRSFPAYGFEDKQKKDIKVTYSGNTAHIEGSWTYDFIRDDQRYKHETVIKMDITNFNDIKNAVITNLSAEELHQYYYSKNGGWELSIWEKGSISASNIPMKNKYGAEGTNKNGAVLNDCFDEGLDGWHRYTWTFLPNQDFSVSVSFSYSE